MNDQHSLKTNYSENERTQREGSQYLQEHEPGPEREKRIKKASLILSPEDLMMDKLNQKIKPLPIRPKDPQFSQRMNLGLPVVDKTKILYQIISSEGAIAVTGPRRFGKTFNVSTLQAIFSQGEEWWRKTCGDLAIV